MAVVLAAALTALGTVTAAYLTIRRPMKKEHATNSQSLNYISGQVDIIVGQTESTEKKIDDHIVDHARGEFG